MHKEITVLSFTIIYVLIDILYIYKSNAYYDNVVKNIQGKPMNMNEKPFKYAVGIATYILLGLCWAYFIGMETHTYTTYTKQMERSFLYALSIYGIFNGTIYLMFENYKMETLLRDTTWGVSSIMLISLLHLFIVKNFLYDYNGEIH